MKKILLSLILLPLQIFAQDFSGNWKGYMEIDGNEVPFEMIIRDIEGGLEGYCMTTLTIDDVENIGVKTLKLKVKKRGLYFEDDELVFSDFSKPGKRIILSATLSFEAEENITEMSGLYRTRSLDFRDQSYFTGKIFLKKMKEPALSRMNQRLSEMKLLPWPETPTIAKIEKIKNNEPLAIITDKKKINETISVKKTDSTLQPATAIRMPAAEVKAKIKIAEKQTAMVDTPLAKQAIVKSTPTKRIAPAAAIAERKIESIHTYLSVGDSIELTFYDNGTIDGDTITVLLDGVILVAKELLSLKPIKRMISIPAGKDSVQLIMYAENLGSFPPNTGLLIMKDGKSRNEIRFTGDMKTNASIILKRRK